MATIKERDALVKKVILAALGDKDLDDEELLERSQICATAAMSIIATVQDDDTFEKAITPFSDNDRIVQRQIRAAVDRITHIDDEATTYTEAPARERARILPIAKELEREDKRSRQ